MYSKSNWDYCISLSNGFSFGPSKETKRTREEIESDGFIECFRFLEQKIEEYELQQIQVVDKGQSE